MCGIIAYVGNTPGFTKSLNGLKMIQNRGYDSSGVCSITNNSLHVTKFASIPTKTSIQAIEDHGNLHNTSTTLIMHTRWATHGIKSDQNSHPHIDTKQTFSIVHNGIIENHNELKQELIRDHGVKFASETDTEVIVQLMGVYYSQTSNVTHAISKTLTRLKGTWALVIMCVDTPTTLYCVRRGSPLLIGFSDTCIMVSSESSGFTNNIREYICMDEDDLLLAQCIDGKTSCTADPITYTRHIMTRIHNECSPYPHPHWMIKEIHEQTKTSAAAMNHRLIYDTIVLGGFEKHVEQLVGINHLILLGCGTSYFAGAHCIPIFRQISGFHTVQILDGSEFHAHDIPTHGTTAVVLLSQSGETKDLLNCIETATTHNLMIIGVVNVVDSAIAMRSSCGVYINAGRENAVASTKSFTSQVIVLNLIAGWFAQQRNIHHDKCVQLVEDLQSLSNDINTTIKSTKQMCKNASAHLIDHEKIFILGKGSSEPIAKEGSLKIKEVAYANSMGYSSSALRHGPFALLERGTPVILINPTDQSFDKNNNVASEVTSRESFVIGISNVVINDDNYDIQITTAHNQSFNSLLAVIPLQIIAYELSVMKQYNPDFPRNLAKTITVD